MHLSAVDARRIITRYYGRAPRYRCFDGCSTGGYQALMEAQRFPGDFDGIVAGAPGAARVRLNAAVLWQYRANHAVGDDTRAILGQRELALLQQGALAACRVGSGDTAGGLAGDGWLNDPAACRFAPGVLACAPARAEPCLAAEQVAAARRMYRGAVDPRSGAQVTNPWLQGSEAGWAAYLSDGRRPQPARTSFWRVWAFADPTWSRWRFDFGRDLDRVRRTRSPVIDAVDPNLARFRVSGGKLLQYDGLPDRVESPLDSTEYYARVAARMPAAERYRLFLVPGMGYCGGGPGFTRFDPQRAIEQWVETRRRPNASRAAPPTAIRTKDPGRRPLETLAAQSRRRRACCDDAVRGNRSDRPRRPPVDGHDAIDGGARPVAAGSDDDRGEADADLRPVRDRFPPRQCARFSRLGIPAQWQADAGIGVASQGGAKRKRARTALPSGLATAATWNPDLAKRGGAMIGEEAHASGFNVRLGGSVNLTREPRNGRNFEYAGKDPLLAGTMAGAQIAGIQSQHIVTIRRPIATPATRSSTKGRRICPTCSPLKSRWTAAIRAR